VASVHFQRNPIAGQECRTAVFTRDANARSSIDTHIPDHPTVAGGFVLEMRKLPLWHVGGYRMMSAEDLGTYTGRF
jgi:hypothetical protein